MERSSRGGDNRRLPAVQTGREEAGKTQQIVAAAQSSAMGAGNEAARAVIPVGATLRAEPVRCARARREAGGVGPAPSCAGGFGVADARWLVL